jgi:hypothetical protein
MSLGSDSQNRRGKLYHTNRKFFSHNRNSNACIASVPEPLRNMCPTVTSTSAHISCQFKQDCNQHRNNRPGRPNQKRLDALDANKDFFELNLCLGLERGNILVDLLNLGFQFIKALVRNQCWSWITPRANQK